MILKGDKRRYVSGPKNQNKYKRKPGDLLSELGWSASGAESEPEPELFGALRAEPLRITADGLCGRCNGLVKVEYATAHCLLCGRIAYIRSDKESLRLQAKLDSALFPGSAETSRHGRVLFGRAGRTEPAKGAQ
jgi:hypothetical protein